MRRNQNTVNPRYYIVPGIHSLTVKHEKRRKVLVILQIPQFISWVDNIPISSVCY